MIQKVSIDEMIECAVCGKYVTAGSLRSHTRSDACKLAKAALELRARGYVPSPAGYQALRLLGVPIERVRDRLYVPRWAALAIETPCAHEDDCGCDAARGRVIVEMARERGRSTEKTTDLITRLVAEGFCPPDEKETDDE
jgi:hypothetical protein